MEHEKHIIDVVAILATLSSLIGWLPPIASALSIIWLCMQVVINWKKFTYVVRGWFSGDRK